MLFPANLLASTEKTKINKSSAIAKMGECLATTDMGQKQGDLLGGSWFPSNTMWPGAEAYLRTK